MYTQPQDSAYVGHPYLPTKVCLYTQPQNSDVRKKPTRFARIKDFLKDAIAHSLQLGPTPKNRHLPVGYG